jgi:hypothetical protein
MPTSTPQRDPESIESEQQAADRPFVPGEPGGNAPLHVVPPTPRPAGPVRIHTSRYDELDEHELIRVLDSIEDELARRRFRESLYISVFICVALAWMVLYGPRYLWHSPPLINPADVMKNRELVQLNAPVLRAAPHPAPKVDTKTLEYMRESAPKPRVPTAPPAAATPTPAQPPPLAAQPLAEAPAPNAPTTKPNFGTPSTSDAMNDLGHSRIGLGGRSGDSMPTGKGGNVGGGVEMLSDPMGMDWTDYLRRLQMDVYRNWIPLLPEETEPPLMKQGETFIEFSILPDGSLEVGGMKLVGSTHDVAIDKAAWGSIVSEGKFPSLPKQFKGPRLTVRFQYMVNKGIR